ncbi:hypothetical protein K3148_06840 [Qipengyuania aurantiaca]|uniref:Uncharacterized protein n=1 Tax=Qipengyuania aurantiaca TaxID=2867233 RepID=A0ABX8ZQ23_9SPHN|nr:hypothetical protein [Qipengyuania aurantiaca]QZD91090.1 hypothetical protein K3148_06840 [Qipengyuania aurantiaca]
MKFRIAAVAATSLALAACGSADDASTEAEAETVEVAADEAMTPIEEEPVADPAASLEPAETAPSAAEAASVEEAGDSAAATAEAAMDAMGEDPAE